MAEQMWVCGKLGLPVKVAFAFARAVQKVPLFHQKIGFVFELMLDKAD